MIDLLIVGSGPAGMTAALYAVRAGLDTLLLEAYSPGGQIIKTSEIENFPGFINIGGFDLAMKLKTQVDEAGVKTAYAEVIKIEKINGVFEVSTSTEKIIAKSVIVCTGASHKKLDVKGENEFFGRGVSYCAVCDGNFYKGKTVCVVGGGNTAVEDVLYLSKICEKVYIIHRRDEFRAVSVLVEKMKKLRNVEIITDSVLTEIRGNEKVDGVVIKNIKTNTEKEISVCGVFISVGAFPLSAAVPKELLNKDGYIETDEKCMTKTEGLFAAGDVRNSPLKQVITACSDGALAATFSAEYIGGIKL